MRIFARVDLLALYVMILGRARLQKPGLRRGQGEGEPAWDSPPLAAGIRSEERDGRVPAGAIRPS